MSTLEPQDAGRTFLGQPIGLVPLFFTELWERFSYYGMRAILILYMVAAPAQGGLGFDVKQATALYGTYTMSVFLTALPGGLFADYVVGTRLAVLIGGLVIACGHFSMVFESMTAFYLGLILIAVGTGLLKPNISAMVGGLYRENDPRRDSGFSIFYMGINVGALMAPIITGYFAQTESFKNFLRANGFNPNAGWHWAFGAAGVGMVIGLIIYVLSQRTLAHVGNKVGKKLDKEGKVEAREPLTSGDWKRIGAIAVFFLFTILFWGAYEQKGASLNLFAKSLVRTEAFGFSFPSSFLQSLTPWFVLILATPFSILWVKLKDRQPSSPAKFTLGLIFIGVAFSLMVPAALLTAQGKISPLWLASLYFLEVCGEMCLSPVGLSTVSKLAPRKLVGIMMGVWFLASALGSKLAGFLSGFFVQDNPWQLAKLFGGTSLGLLVSAGILALLTPSVKRLMGHVK